ncbi:MAG: 2-C-methyl-D-erythritol 4-phosphate cytidylyltransferase [Bacilli bacterium]
MNYALILAAGTGSRMGNTDKPKQFLPIYGKPLVVHTVEAFEMHEEIEGIVIATNEAYVDQVKVWCKQYDLSKVKAVVAGSDSRQKSVFNGLMALKKFVNDDDILLIHDAARPLISSKIISDNIKECQISDAVDTVIKASDTIICSKDDKTIDNIPNRSELYQGQTPQTFKFSLIIKAHEMAMNNVVNNVTDDAKLVLSLGYKVSLVEGSKQNFKVTTFDDLMMLKALLKIGKTEVL